MLTPRGDFYLRGITLRGPGDIAVDMANGTLTARDVNVEGFHTAFEIGETGAVDGRGITHSIRMGSDQSDISE
jgi:hypothetical protein